MPSLRKSLKGKNLTSGKDSVCSGVCNYTVSEPKLMIPENSNENIHNVDHLGFTHGRGIMSKQCHCCCDDHNEQVKVHKMTLDDGRHAEKHVSFDDAGNEVVEIFAEEKRPLKLEKRVIRQYKNVVSQETHETIRDGEVSQVEVHAGEPDVRLRVVDRIGVANHAKIVDGDYVRKDEIGKIVADSVVAGVTALMENMEPVVQKETPQPQPVFRAMSVVENNVAEKKKTDSTSIAVLGVVLLAQMAFFGYYFFVM